MSEDTEQANSTAQLEFPQEIAADEANVVDESPSDEGGSDNMSLSELTTQLLARDEEQKEGGEADAGEAASEETSEQTEPEKIEQPGLVAVTDEGETDKKVLLENYGINLDELGEDEAMSLGRALRTESLKRFGRLTAQKREAEAKVRDLEGKASTEVESDSVVGGDNPMSDVWTTETLQKKEADLQAIEDWAEDALQSEAEYDDDGEEYLVEADGKKYSKQDLLGIRSNARKMRRKGGALDKRQDFLAQRQHFDGEALQYFPWMADEKSSEFGEYQQFVQNPKYVKLLDSIPEANVFAGLVVEGNLRVRERASAKNGASGQAKEKPVTPALASSAAPKRVSTSDGSRIQREVSQAQKAFEKTGSIQSLARLRQVQAQMS